jgi:hypothetical protein
MIEPPKLFPQHAGNDQGFPVRVSIHLGKQGDLFSYTVVSVCPHQEQAELIGEFVRASQVEVSKEYVVARLYHLLRETGLPANDAVLPAVLDLFKELNVRVK